MRFCKKIMIFFALVFVIAAPVTPVFSSSENVQAVTSEVQGTNDKSLLHSLTNVADEEIYERKKTGIQVVGFLVIYAFIMWRVKKKIWKEEAHKKKNNSTK